MWCLFGLVAKKMNCVEGFIGEMLQAVGLVPSFWKYIDTDLPSYHTHIQLTMAAVPMEN